MMNQKEHYGTYRFLGYFVPANNNNMEREKKKIHYPKVTYSLIVNFTTTFNYTI